MPPMTGIAHRVVAILLGVCASAGASGAGPEIRFHPVWGDGNVLCLPGEHPCRENEIILLEGDATVTMFIQVSGWDPDQDGDPTLGAFLGTLDWDTLASGHISGEDTLGGVDLVPVGYPDTPYLGAFTACKVCSDDFFVVDMTDPNIFLSDCTTDSCSAQLPAPYIFCVDRPDFVFYQIAPCPWPVTTALPDYSWRSASTTCRADPDGSTWFYGGTLLLDVPVNAQGTYNVNFIDDSNFTLLNSCLGPLIPNLTLTPGRITIVGACCTSDGTCELLPEAVCTDAGGAFFSADCGGDLDGDGAFEPCDPCPLDNPDDTDGDGTCDSDDGCRFDPNKVEPGLCGCGVDDNADSDGDGIADCHDQCPGIDDAAFGPDCANVIPAMSDWGFGVLTLLLLVALKLSSLHGRQLDQHGNP